jgi:Holliday junction resolvase RusA-like endonuclease
LFSLSSGYGHVIITSMKTFVCRFTILSEPASKANSRRLVTIRGRPAFIKSSKALGYVAAVRLQVRPLHPLPSTDVCLNLHMYYATRRPDLDESALLDALQGLLYVNDRQVKERHTYWHLDKTNPRVEGELYLL